MGLGEFCKKISNVTNGIIWNSVIAIILLILIQAYGFVIVKAFGSTFWEKYEFYTLCGSTYSMAIIYIFAILSGASMIILFLTTLIFLYRLDNEMLEQLQKVVLDFMDGLLITKWVVLFCMYYGYYEFAPYLSKPDSITPNAILAIHTTQILFPKCRANNITSETCVLTIHQDLLETILAFLMVESVFQILLLECSRKLGNVLKIKLKNDNAEVKFNRA